MKCPYPDCAARSTGDGQVIEHDCQAVARHVYLCAHCRRLSLRCEKGNCLSLNRPYSLYCRSCGDDARDNVWFGSAAAQWGEARRFRAEALVACKAGAAAADLHRFADHLPLDPLVELRFLDGLIAVHQAGVFACLLHPFREQTPVIWKVEEGRQSSFVTAAFPPFRMPENRFVIFSSPQRAMAVDVWSLSGWSHAADPMVNELFRADADVGRALVAAPVALSDQELGLLTRDSGGQVGWRVVALGSPTGVANSPAPDSPSGTHAWTPLPLEGEPCRSIQISNQAVAFATPRGHWLWRLEHARRSQVAELVGLHRPPAEEPLWMDERESRSDHFAYPRHYLDFRPARRPGDTAFISWYFVQSEGPNRSVGNYRFYFDDPRPQTPVFLEHRTNATPLGVLSSEGRSRMLFLSEGRLFCDDSGDSLSPYDRHIRLPNESELTGLNYHEPLLIGIRPRNQGHQLSIHALGDRPYQRQIDVEPLRSDPLAWASWLWTLELDSGQLVVRRRNFDEESVHG